MSNDGRWLEDLVAFVEETLLPKGMQVTPRKRVLDDQGRQIAELDIAVSGKVGTTSLTWLIECRDRPSEGPAPRSWIEQLIGRRQSLGLNKVTAVSTTGFASGAVDCATQWGIELREVKALAPDQFKGWLAMQHMGMHLRERLLHRVTVFLEESTPKEVSDAAYHMLANSKSNQLMLRAEDAGKVVSADQAFEMLLSQNPRLWDDVKPNSEGRPVTLRVSHDAPDSPHILMETPKGNARVLSIEFEGALTLREALLPFEVNEYARLENSDPISQVAAVQFAAAGEQFALELHRIPESGIRVLIRKLT